jgi:hypothetical protein
MPLAARGGPPFLRLAPPIFVLSFRTCYGTGKRLALVCAFAPLTPPKGPTPGLERKRARMHHKWPGLVSAREPLKPKVACATEPQ